MSADPLMLVPGFLVLAFAIRLGLIVPMWEGIKSGLLWLVSPRRIQRRTPLQIRFKTSMKWHDVRWSIARMEHEMFPKDEWTHEVEDCVHPDCNPDFIRKVNGNKLSYIPRAGNKSRVPILPSPPPPPPARRFPDPGRTEKR